MSEHIPRPTLLYPEPHKRSDLISWGAANLFLVQEHDRGGAGFVKTFLAAAQEHPAPLVRAQVTEIARWDTHAERGMALLGAASKGHIIAYAKRIDDQMAYETTPALWLAASPCIANPVTIALSGRLSLVTDLLDHGSLEVRLAGSPILLDKGALTTLLTKRTGNAAERLQAARAVVEEWRANHHVPMRKAEFKRTLRQRLPGVSERALDRLWLEVVPAAWREPGPRRE